MDNNTNKLTIFQPQNVEAIVKLGPDSFNRNTLSHERCLNAGEALLARLRSEGMSDALDQEIANYIVKSKITLRNMNERRAPVTKLFDMIRTEYTRLENAVDPAKKDTVPGQLQAARNEYAAKKLAEAEARRRAEAERIARENAISRFRIDVQEDFKAQLNRYIVSQVNVLMELESSLSLENYDLVLDTVRRFCVDLPDSWAATLGCSVPLPVNIAPAESQQIRADILASMLPSLREHCNFELTANRDDILDRLPSKRRELERLAKASAEEAERIRNLMAERERQEAQRKEAERIAREAAEKEAADMAAQKARMDGLFGAAAADTAAYQPKTAVRKRLQPLDAEGFKEIVGLWWSQEGCNLSVEELSKIFKRQLTFCEKIANDKRSPLMLESKHVAYVDDIKAK